MHRIGQFFIGLGANGVTFFGAIDCDRGDAVSRLINDVFVVQDTSPINAPANTAASENILYVYKYIDYISFDQLLARVSSSKTSK